MTSIELKLEEFKAKKKGRRLSAENFGDVWSYATVFNNMNFIFANVLNESQNGASTSLYHMLLETCGPKDSFITFNWDTLLDRALTDSGGWTPQDGYGVSFASVLEGTWKKKISGKPQYKTNWKLLKLHGSVNWLVPYLGVNFQSLKYVSIVPESDRVFLYWHSSLPYPTHHGRWRGGYAPTCYGYYPPNIPGRLFNRLRSRPVQEGFSSHTRSGCFRHLQNRQIRAYRLLRCSSRQFDRRNMRCTPQRLVHSGNRRQKICRLQIGS